MTTWEADYGQHRIRIENHFSNERLIIDGETADQTVGTIAYRGKLAALLPSGELVVANLGGRMFSVDCNLFVAGKQVNVTKL